MFDAVLAYENGKEYAVCECNIKTVVAGTNVGETEVVETIEPFVVGEQKSEVKFVKSDNTVITIPLTAPVNPTCGSCGGELKKQIVSDDFQIYPLYPLAQDNFKVDPCDLKKCKWAGIGAVGTFIDCKPLVFTMSWDDNYGTAEDPFEYSLSKPILPIEIKLKDPAVATIACKDGCDGSFVKFEQVPPVPGNIAKLTIDPAKTTEYNKMFSPLIEAESKIELCEDTSKLTTKYYFRLNYDCSGAVAGKDCKDPPQIESCKKACPTDYCEFDGKDCYTKKPGGSTKPADDSAAKPSEQGAAITNLEYNQEYFKKLNPKPDGYVGALPDCAFSGTCRNTNDLVQLIINFGQGMFAILGSFAFVFFVYGGFTIILSMGNAEKVNKGKQILGAAIVGLVVAFCAYLLIDFMLEALQVKDAFKGIK